jgi:hypothetical protein
VVIISADGDDGFMFINAVNYSANATLLLS